MYAAYRWGRCGSKRRSPMGLNDDDKFHTVHVYPKPDHYPEKREFFVEIEGVVKKTYPIKAESSAKASQMAKSEFIIEFGGDKEKILINDVWKSK